MAVNYRARVAATAADITADDWSRLQQWPSLHNSQAWYELIETPPPGDGEYEPRYLVADEHGGLTGILPTFRMTRMTRHGYNPAELFTDLLPHALQSSRAWLPGIAAGGISGYHTDLLLDRTLPEKDRRSALRRLLDQALSDLVQDRLPALWFSYLSADDASLVCEVLGAEATPPLLTEVEMAIPIDFTDFDGYVDRLPRRWQKATRRERKQFLDSGATVETGGFELIDDEVVELYANMIRRYNGPDATERARRHLERQRRLSPWALVRLCRRSGRPIGFELQYMVGTTLSARVGGYDYQRASSFEHFNLLYYESLLAGAAAGCDTLHLGVAAYYAKLRRGGRPRLMWSVLYRPDGSLKEVSRLAAAYNRAKLDRLIEGRPPAAGWTPGDAALLTAR